MPTETRTPETVPEELRHMWRTRPARIPSEGGIAGVAAGIGHRYDVDPLLVRVAFVVSAIFGGSGIGLYAAAWLVFPSPEGPDAVGEYLRDRHGRRRDGYHRHGRGRNAKRLVLLIVLVIIVASSAPLGHGVGGAGLFGAVIMLGGLYLLYRRRPVPPGAAVPTATGGDAAQSGGATAAPEGGAVRPAEHHDAAAPTDAAPADPPDPADPAAPAAADPAGAAGAAGTARGDPPDWDPLGAAPFAWDLPAPAPDPPKQPMPRRRSRITPITLGLALLAAAAAVALAMTGVGWMTPARIGAVALAVVGAGLLIGAVLCRGHGLLLAAAPLAAFVVLASLAPHIEFHGAVGQRDYHPATVAELQDAYRIDAGQLNLDLAGLELAEDRTVDVSTSVGSIRVTVPEGMAVRTDCETNLGSTDCLAGPADTDDPILTVQAHSYIGEVVVGRG